MDAEAQVKIDETLIALDGTPNKSRLGANAILGVSLAVAKAAAIAHGAPLYRYVGGTAARLLPVPMMNIVNGGVHADNPIDFQEFMIMPVGAASFAEGLRMGVEMFQTLQVGAQAGRPQHQRRRRGRLRAEPAVGRARRSISSCRRSRRPATRPARMSCWRSIAPRPSSSRTAPIVTRAKARPARRKSRSSISPSSSRATRSCRSRTAWRRTIGRAGSCSPTLIGSKCQLVGDDLFVTNVTRLSEGIKKGIANSILIKVNQIGTLTETLAAVEMAHKAGYTAVMSHRSGETEDSTIADLAVATNCGQIKTGSLARSDRTAKYNQLLRIEEDLGAQAKYAGRAALKVLR